MKKRISPGMIIANVLIGLLAIAFIVAVFQYSDKLLNWMQTPTLVSDTSMPQQFLFSASEWWEDDEFPNRAIREEKAWNLTLSEARSRFDEYRETLTEQAREKLDEKVDYLTSIEVQNKLKNRIHNYHNIYTVTEIEEMTPAIDSDKKLVVIYSLTITKTTFDEEENEIVEKLSLDIYGRLPD